MEYAKRKTTIDSFISVFLDGIYDDHPGREDTFMLSFLLPSMRTPHTMLYQHKHVFDDMFKKKNNSYKCYRNCAASVALRFPRGLDEFKTMYGLLQFSEDYNVQADRVRTFLIFISCLLIIAVFFLVLKGSF